MTAMRNFIFLPILLSLVISAPAPSPRQLLTFEHNGVKITTRRVLEKLIDEGMVHAPTCTGKNRDHLNVAFSEALDMVGQAWNINNDKTEIAQKTWQYLFGAYNDEAYTRTTFTLRNIYMWLAYPNSDMYDKSTTIDATKSSLRNTQIHLVCDDANDPDEHCNEVMAGGSIQAYVEMLVSPAVMHICPKFFHSSFIKGLLPHKRKRTLESWERVAARILIHELAHVSEIASGKSFGWTPWVDRSYNTRTIRSYAGNPSDEGGQLYALQNAETFAWYVTRLWAEKTLPEKSPWTFSDDVKEGKRGKWKYYG